VVSLLLLPVFGGRSGEHPREAGIYSLIGYQSRGVKAEEVSQTHRVLDVQVRKGGRKISSVESSEKMEIGDVIAQERGRPARCACLL
jgi:hypothetical protein